LDIYVYKLNISKMSYFSAITEVEQFHNPNEGRVIINENFRKMISGVSESISSISGTTTSGTPTLLQVLSSGNTTGNNNIIADTSSGDTISIISNNNISTNRSGISFVDGGADLDYILIGDISLLKGGFVGIEQSRLTLAYFSGSGVNGPRIEVDSSGISMRTEGPSESDFIRGSDINLKISPNDLSGYYSQIVPSGLTEDRNHYLQNSSGTIAHLEDISSAISNLTPYIEYRANLTQTSTNAPVATELGTQTLTGGSWSYSSTGSYYYTNTGMFSAASNVEISIPNAVVRAFSMSNSAFYLISAAVVSDDIVEVRTSKWGSYALSGSSSQFVTPGDEGGSVDTAMSDDILNNSTINIRVWS
jgi:hypothetical protein